MEEQKFTVRMAGLPIEIRSRMEFTRSLCRDYEIPEEQAVFTAASSRGRFEEGAASQSGI